MLSLNSQPNQHGTSSAEKFFGHKLRTTLPSLIPFTQSTTTEKHTVTQNLRRKLPGITPRTKVWIQTDEQDLWDKKGIVVSQNNHPRLYEILNEKGNTLASRYLIPATKKFNIKHDYDNIIPVRNTSTYPNLMIDNEHEKPTLEDVYRTRSGRIAKKPKRYTDEKWYYLFLTSGLIINKPKHTEMWDDLFDKAMYWRNVIYMILITFVLLLRMIAGLKKKVFLVFHILKEGDFTYLPSHLHLIYFIYQSSSNHFMKQSPTHSFRHSFPSHSFYRS